MEIFNSRKKSVVFTTTIRPIFLAVLIFSMLVSCAGNTKMGGGAKTGAAIGAGVGLLMGALTGDAEVAVVATAVGAGAGAAEGAYEGWKQDQDDKRTEQIAQAIRESNQSGGQQGSGDAEVRAREELTRFIGVWAMEGWVQSTERERLNVRARVNADVQMSYFVELAYIDLEVTGVDNQMWGTSTIGYDETDGYNISTRFNTLPEPLRVTGGTWDQSSRSFDFKQSDYRLVISFDTPDRFTVNTFLPAGGREQQVESYTFTRT